MACAGGLRLRLVLLSAPSSGPSGLALTADLRLPPTLFPQDGVRLVTGSPESTWSCFIGMVVSRDPVQFFPIWMTVVTAPLLEQTRLRLPTFRVSAAVYRISLCGLVPGRLSGGPFFHLCQVHRLLAAFPWRSPFAILFVLMRCGEESGKWGSVRFFGVWRGQILFAVLLSRSRHTGPRARSDAPPGVCQWSLR